MQHSGKRTRSATLKAMLEELERAKKERKDAMEEITASQVKTEPGSEDEPPVVRCIAGQFVQEGIGRFHKGKGKGNVVGSGVCSERNMYHATLYRRSLSTRSNKRSKVLAKIQGKAASVGNCEASPRMVKKGKGKVIYSGSAGGATRKTSNEKVEQSSDTERIDVDLNGLAYSKHNKEHKAANASVKKNPSMGKRKAVDALSKEMLHGKGKCNMVNRKSVRCVQGGPGSKDKKKGKVAETYPGPVGGNSAPKEYFTVASDSERSDTEGMYTPIYEEEEEEYWIREVMDLKKTCTNVLQFPVHVINSYLRGRKGRIVIYDVDKEVPYYCEIKKRALKKEMYLIGGWYDFAKEAELKVGDKLHFVIRYPPVDEIMVHVERRGSV
ncbi:uncharacterized protein LOC131599512 [Vicia villosa]|uniref:uncharacterized protein LOC131599512 n=1 Tax=Vicia villosa TaxID=3911 RepID=UPI00273C7083|nr:uncharacterized protein LOC131599512 [Vicia villosa]